MARGCHNLLLISLMSVPSVVSAQTVQLPTFRYTTVNTTVSVPDRGGIYLGGVNRAATASSSRGVPLAGRVPGVSPLARSRGISRTTSASSMSVHATIIDHAELDRRVLAEAARRRADGSPAVDLDAERRAAFLSRHVGRPASELNPTDASSIVERSPSAEEIRLRNEAARQKRDAEVVAYYDQAKAAFASGKRGAARVYLQMAARRATGEQKLQIEAALAALSGSPSRTSVALSHSDR